MYFANSSIRQQFPYVVPSMSFLDVKTVSLRNSLHKMKRLFNISSKISPFFFNLLTSLKILSFLVLFQELVTISSREDEKNIQKPNMLLKNLKILVKNLILVKETYLYDLF